MRVVAFLFGMAVLLMFESQPALRASPGLHRLFDRVPRYADPQHIHNRGHHFVSNRAARNEGIARFFIFVERHVIQDEIFPWFRRCSYPGSSARPIMNVGLPCSAVIASQKPSCCQKSANPLKWPHVPAMVISTITRTG